MALNFWISISIYIRYIEMAVRVSFIRSLTILSSKNLPYHIWGLILWLIVGSHNQSAINPVVISWIPAIRSRNPNISNGLCPISSPRSFRIKRYIFMTGPARNEAIPKSSKEVHRLCLICRNSIRSRSLNTLKCSTKPYLDFPYTLGVVFHINSTIFGPIHSFAKTGIKSIVAPP